MNDNEGQIAVRVARQVVEAEAKGSDAGGLDFPGTFRDKMGVFVTLSTYPEDELRGCIGYPEPVYSLGTAIIRAAQGACHDPRFPPLLSSELDSIIVEVSILTVPQEVVVKDRKALKDMIQIGRDGLIMENGPYRGLLLPQVPVEWEWDTLTFLEQTCIKAGLLPDMWLDKGTKVFRFQAEVFSESAPHGQVQRKELG